MSLPPYARIVAELRQEIEAGVLVPGARVPSTREITQRWGVAMATATKALAALRQEGLVRAIPGVGTIVGAAADTASTAGPTGTNRALASSAAPVAARAASPAPAGGHDAAQPILTSSRIVAAAIAVADAEGLDGLSMRRVAAEIGVATMSLYRHVADKDDLLLQMMDAAFVEWQFPASPPDGWRDRLEFAARTLWEMFRRHPWLAPALSVTRPQPIAGGVAGMEWVLAALDGQGLDLATMMTTHITLFTYVRGTAMNLELEAAAEAATGLSSEEWMQAQEPALRSFMTPGRFPVFERLVATEYDFDLDAIFEFGLQRLLDGLSVLINGPPAAIGSPAPGL
jgi:AcrR family transcriptional regulator/DNA-binding transcriptional regulator YhcF (GntR family)